MARLISLTRSSVLLTLTGGIEFGLQIAIPMIFVRYLEPAAFGEYRLLWLMAGTALAIAPAFMPQSLFYFLPRATPPQKRIFIGNVLGYLTVAGAVVALASSVWNPLVPASVRSLFTGTNGLSAVFLGSWVLASVMNVLPTGEGRVGWQSASDISLALFRTMLLAGAAVFTQDLVWVVAAMLIEAIARLVMMGAYLVTRPEGGMVTMQCHLMKTQLKYALPFAAGNALFLMRVQADQWVVASMLPTALFATFSIAAVFLPVGTLLRQPIHNAMMPRLNKAFSTQDLLEFRRLIAKGAGVTAMMLLPVAGALFSITDELVNIIYTARYANAAAVMRIYLLGIMFSAFAVGHALTALDKGRFAVGNNACCLIISVICSIAGTSQWGIIGAASGSVLTLVLSELWSMRVVAKTLGVATRHLLPWRAIGPPVLGTVLGILGVEAASGVARGPLLALAVFKGVIFVTLFAVGFLAGGGWRQFQLLKSSGREAA